MADTSSTVPVDSGSEAPACGDGSPYNGKLGLRIGAIFIIFVTSLFGTLFPILTRRLRRTWVPPLVYEFAKYFGSGVIIATAFIHLLAPATESLGSECLTGAWTVYPWPQAIAMASVFLLFIIEMIAFRWGHAKLAALGIAYHSHGGNGSTSHGQATPRAGASLVGSQGPMPEDDIKPEAVEAQKGDLEGNVTSDTSSFDEKGAAAQILGVAILEFGVIFHSVVIGLTLAVDEDFITLFVVIIFHQMFEGLGLGSRLSQLPLPSHLGWVPVAGGWIYSAVTPLGIAIGLGVRTTYNPESRNALITSGVLDAFSAGVLLYTGLVELLAHDFVFNKHMMHEASNAELAFAIGCILFGAGIMALLGRWA